MKNKSIILLIRERPLTLAAVMMLIISTVGCEFELNSDETELEKLCGDNVLWGVQRIDNQQDVQAIDDANITWIDGELRIENSDLEDLSGLGSIRCVRGFAIVNNPNLLSTDGLYHLGYSGKGMYIANNPNLKDFDSLQSLSTVNASTIVEDNPELISITGLSGIEKIITELRIEGNSSLEDIEELRGLSIEPDVLVRIVDNEKIARCDVEELLEIYAQDGWTGSACTIGNDIVEECPEVSEGCEETP